MKGFFHICPLDDDPVWDGPIELYPPHRHDFQEIIVLVHGQAMHRIDGKKSTIKAPSVVLVAQDKMHLFITQDKSRGWLIRFTNEYLPMEITHLFSQFTELSTISLSNKVSYTQIVDFTKLLLKVYQGDGPAKQRVLQLLLAALLNLLKAEEQQTLENNQVFKPDDYQLFCAFLRSVDESFKHQKRIELYARALNTTVRRLRAICKAIYNKTPSRIVELRCIVEAKRILLYSNESIKQIAFLLGYEDHSYFTKIFTRVTGATPTAFRLHHGYEKESPTQ